VASLEAALAVLTVHEKLKLFPIIANSKLPLPGFTNFFDRATRDVDQIRKWWRCPVTDMDHGYNIAISTDDLLVIDIDIKGKSNGFDTLESLGITLPPTLVAITPSGGEHWYFTYPKRVRNGVGHLKSKIPGVDIRGHHGYVVAPGSIIDGKSYRWKI
jgi:hypothetical protein